jgi:hypothetical protein
MSDISTIGEPQLDSESIIDIAIDKTPLSNEQAKQLTHSIRDAAEVIWILIARAHAGKAWKVMGYESWEDYVKSEFNMSRSRSYQLLDQAKVITAIEEALPSDIKVNITEAAARELKAVLEDAIPEIRTATENLDGEEALAVTETILAKYREKAHSEVDPVFDNEGDSEPTQLGVSNDDPNISNYGEVPDVGSSGGSPKEQLAEPKLQPYDSTPSGTPSNQIAAPTTEELNRIRKFVNAAHDIYSSLSALSSLPTELDEIIATIPEERHSMIENNLESAMANLSEFSRIWRTEKDSLGTGNEEK